MLFDGRWPLIAQLSPRNQNDLACMRRRCDHFRRSIISPLSNGGSTQKACEETIRALQMQSVTFFGCPITRGEGPRPSPHQDYDHEAGDGRIRSCSSGGEAFSDWATVPVHQRSHKHWTKGKQPTTAHTIIMLRRTNQSDFISSLCAYWSHLALFPPPSPPTETLPDVVICDISVLHQLLEIARSLVRQATIRPVR